MDTGVGVEVPKYLGTKLRHIPASELQVLRFAEIIFRCIPIGLKLSRKLVDENCRIFERVAPFAVDFLLKV